MFSSALAIGQIQPDALDLLRRVGQTYTSASQYEIRSVLTTTDNDAEINSMSAYLAFKSPDKYRLDMKATALAAGERVPPRNEFLNVFDGSILWNYFPKLNEYSTYVSRFPDGMRPQDVDLFIGVGSFRNLTGFFDKRGGAKCGYSGRSASQPLGAAPIVSSSS